jgi:hypothetical protein
MHTSSSLTTHFTHHPPALPITPFGPNLRTTPDLSPNRFSITPSSSPNSSLIFNTCLIVTTSKNRLPNASFLPKPSNSASASCAIRERAVSSVTAGLEAGDGKMDWAGAEAEGWKTAPAPPLPSGGEYGWEARGGMLLNVEECDSVGTGWTGPSWLSLARCAKSGSWESRSIAVGYLVWLWDRKH